jgi:prophage regulatory protein
MCLKFLRLPAVIRSTGRSRSSVYADIADGLFPRQVALGPRSAGWPEHEVDAVQRARLAGQDPAEIRALVAQLHSERAAWGAA